MPLNLSGADKTFKRYAAIEGANHPPVHDQFVHEPATGDAIKPDDTPAFSAVAATDLITTTGHGLVADVPIVFPTSTATGLTAPSTVYYVIASGLTANAFKVSTTKGGSAVDVTADGAGTWKRYLTDDQQAQVDSWRLQAQSGNWSTISVTDPVALLTIQAWQAYENNPTHKGWLIDDFLTRHWQWIMRSADHADKAQGVTPPSADPGGSGGGGFSFPAGASPN